ncbi:hypothetical protein [uncultured Herbaspirillum sp.]|uniref:hypothetical protein n=1 Tax=uncultured Herbaspirillum sp. TaxID=160236 RepID=UPI0025857044|nr:hypothetical protein [uncultured Herbaspirillum sp.]
MRRKRPHDALSDELLMAIGLVWGYFSAYQYEGAHELAQGCLQVWPDDPKLFLMASYAAAELLEPVDRERLEAMRNKENEAWIDLIVARLDAGEASQALSATTR